MLRNFLILLIFIQFTQGVEAKNKEVGANTEAVISCVISGIASTLDDSVSWTDSSDGALVSDDTNYVIADGSYDDSTNSQTTTLTVKAGVASDSTFSCVVTSAEWSGTATDIQTEVTLNVFGKTDSLSLIMIMCLPVIRIVS